MKDGAKGRASRSTFHTEAAGTKELMAGCSQYQVNQTYLSLNGSYL